MGAARGKVLGVTMSIGRQPRRKALVTVQLLLGKESASIIMYLRPPSLHLFSFPLSLFLLYFFLFLCLRHCSSRKLSLRYGGSLRPRLLSYPSHIHPQTLLQFCRRLWLRWRRRITLPLPPHQLYARLLRAHTAALSNLTTLYEKNCNPLHANSLIHIGVESLDKYIKNSIHSSWKYSHWTMSWWCKRRCPLEQKSLNQLLKKSTIFRDPWKSCLR